MIYFNGGFFDIVIGNPPYIKENTDKSVFDGLRKSIYYQGKMDLWYLFACVGLDFVKTKGVLSFIATNNWITNSGASKLRNKILNDSKINRYVDFSNFKIFESAGIQTMIFILEKNSNNEKYTFDYSKLLNSNIDFVDLKKFLLKEVDSDFFHFDSQIIKKDFINKTIDFNDSIVTDILLKIESKRNFYLDGKTEINSGIDIPQDFVNKSSLEILGNGSAIGDGIFVLSNDEVNKLDLNENEKNLLKPFYTPKELFRYSVSNENKFWIIYTDSSFKDSHRMKEFPNLKAHLDKFQKVITSENKPYGLNRARNERYFLSEKILVQRKCPTKPSFVYVDFHSYVNRTFIPIKTERINLKYLVGILNSKLCQFWLKYKGKMQGDNFQVDKDPILQIPIFKALEEDSLHVINLVDKILNKKKQGEDIQELENQINKLIYKLYELTDDEIAIIEK